MMSNKKRFKAGDKVLMKSKSWYDSMPKDSFGSIHLDNLDGVVSFDSTMIPYLGTVVEIDEDRGTYYYIKDDKREHGWSESMMELNKPARITKH